jgi:hypothetical protein
MSTCPYTWVKGLFSPGSKPSGDLSAPAKNLMVRVVRNGEERVRVSLPARSARWLIELIPADVIAKIKAEEIPLDAMMEDLSLTPVLYPRPIFSLAETGRTVDIWLE